MMMMDGISDESMKNFRCVQLVAESIFEKIFSRKINFEKNQENIF